MRFHAFWAATIAGLAARGWCWGLIANLVPILPILDLAEDAHRIFLIRLTGEFLIDPAKRYRKKGQMDERGHNVER